MSLPSGHIARDQAALTMLTDALDQLPGRVQRCVERAADGDAALLPVSDGYPGAVRRR
ncbi:hypothetical protein [Nonomuraea fuscirosea]|uniref:hypothetical protein n=1 Tax=Nonomuraea fuscirosea TaxID=1291556 RepID=UPI003407B53B